MLASAAHAARRWVRARLSSLRSSQAGMSLAEILCAVTILGLTVPAILAGLGTISLASDHHRKQATADTVMKSYAESLKQLIQTVGYRNCATNSTAPTTSYAIPATVWTPPSGYSVSIVAPTGAPVGSSAVEYWHAAIAAPADPFNTTCAADEGAQRLTLQVVSPDKRDTEKLQIIVRKP
jgi:type II secretory pathway pseudopilin PulG